MVDRGVLSGEWGFVRSFTYQRRCLTCKRLFSHRFDCRYCDDCCKRLRRR